MHENSKNLPDTEVMEILYMKVERSFYITLIHIVYSHKTFFNVGFGVWIFCTFVRLI